MYALRTILTKDVTSLQLALSGKLALKKLCICRKRDQCPLIFDLYEAMARAVSRRLIDAKDRFDLINSMISVLEKLALGHVFSQYFCSPPCQYHSSKAPYSIYMLLFSEGPTDEAWKPFKNYYRIFRQITRSLSIQKRSKFVKNEHARYILGIKKVKIWKA